MKEKYSAVLLTIFGGGIGLHKFYLRKIASGVLYAMFFWTFIPFLLSFIDRLYYLFMDKEKFDLKYNSQNSIKGKSKTSKANDAVDNSLYLQFKEIKELFDCGAISNEEFDVLKNKIIEDLEK